VAILEGFTPASMNRTISAVFRRARIKPLHSRRLARWEAHLEAAARCVLVREYLGKMARDRGSDLRPNPNLMIAVRPEIEFPV
jgi:hypothetical protein